MRANQWLAHLWLDALATELGASAGTIDTYTDDLNCYLASLDERSLSLDDVGLGQVRDYVAALDPRGYAGLTIARRITVVRGLHRFLIAEELGSRDPTATVTAMKRSRKLPFVLSLAETEALLETAHALAADPSVGLYRQAGYALRAALFETLYASGMRISEALSLPSDAARQGRQTAAGAPARAIAAISQWRRLASAYSGGAPSPWLFHLVRNGAKALTRQAALLKIKEAAVAAGLASPNRVSLHVLRHAFATQIYTHLDTSRLHQMVRDLHPLNTPRGGDATGNHDLAAEGA